MDATTLRAIEDWKRLGFGPGTGVNALLIAQDDSGDGGGRAERLRDLCVAEGATMAEVSASETESRQLLDIRRLAYPAVERLGTALVEDVCVPRTRLTEMVELIGDVAARHGVFIATVAHAGDGNLHPVFVSDRALPDIPEPVWAAADEIFHAALALGGTLTGEHGVGTIKRRWLAAELGEESMAVHHAIKRALDPAGILNPGRAI